MHSSGEMDEKYSTTYIKVICRNYDVLHFLTLKLSYIFFINMNIML